jgi:adenylate kinase
MKRDIVIFIGPPGSGKGSLAQLCMRQLGWLQLSTGNLCRQHIAQQTEMGRQIDFFIKSGKLISDSLIMGMVEQWLTECIEGECPILLDGFPRTICQAQALDKLLKMHPFSCMKLMIVNLSLPDCVVLKRLGSRLTCQNIGCQAVYSAADRALAPRQISLCDNCSSPVTQRSDDHSENVIKERLRIYYEHASSLLAYYEQSSHLFRNVAAEGSLDEVFSRLLQAIGLVRI